jgi:tetratricopeptide (TPR) repeat protein
MADIEKDVEKFRKLSEQIDELYNSGKDKEGEQLLHDALKAASKNEAYRLFFEGEVAGYKEENLVKQEAKFREAVKLRHNDYFLLRNLGVSLSKQGKYDEAIAYYEQALKIKPDDYDSLRGKGVSLSNQGKEDEAIAYFDQALKIKPDDYSSLRQKGVSLSYQDKEDEAIAYFDQALKIKPDDYDSLRNKGVSLSEQGKEDEAIAYFDQALKIKPDDYRSLRNKGVSLSNQGKEDEAIAYFDQALKIKTDDYRSLRQKGVSLSNQGKEDEAIAYFDQALKIKPDDYRSYISWALSALSLDRDIALEKIKVAYGIAPTNKDVLYYLQHICTITNENLEDVIKNISPGSQPQPIMPDMAVITGLVIKVRDKFESSIDEFVKKKKESEKRLDDFLLPHSSMHDNKSFFLILRKWNSYTPIIPSNDEERSLGGGYFIKVNGKGTVIDPGFNFIENFYKAGCRLIDIDNVVITHAHNDHTNDFESIMTLIHKYNDRDEVRSGVIKFKKINLYLNTGSFKKFSGFLDLRGNEYIEMLYTMTPGSFYVLDKTAKPEEPKIIMTVLPAYHDELVTKKYAVGLHFLIKTNTGDKQILLTSDTGLYQQKKNTDGKNVADTKSKEIHELYGECKADIDLLIPHIGSIKEEEIRGPLHDKDKIFYPNHLGILGTAQMITKIKPKLAVVSEFGEEMRLFREDLMGLLVQVVDGFFGNVSKPVVLPGDLPFIYEIETGRIYCILTKDMVSFEKIQYWLYSGDSKACEDNFYYYNSEQPQQLKLKLSGHAIDFEKDRADRRMPYLR